MIRARLGARLARLPLAAWIFASAAAVPLGAQSRVEDPRESEWMLSGGYGWTIGTGPSDPHQKYVAVFPELAWPVKPHVAYLVTGHASWWFPRDGWVIGILPAGGRLELLRGRRTAPYVCAAVGVGWTNLTGLDEIDRRFNFLAQWGAGIRRRSPGGHDWFAEFRYFHVSNMGTAGNNWGLNTLLVLAGRGL